MSSPQIFRVLIADEDYEMRDLIAGILQAEYLDRVITQTCATGRELLLRLKENDFSLAIVNWNLPELSRIPLLQEMRSLKTAAELAILVTVPGYDPEQVANVLEAGASDCLSRPFDRVHLLRKVGSFVKNLSQTSNDAKKSWGDLSLDLRTQDVYFRSERIRLTPSEFKLLQALIDHKGAIQSREELIEKVQGEGIAVIDRAVDTHIFSLRKKLGDCADMVETVRGSGYRIKEIS